MNLEPLIRYLKLMKFNVFFLLIIAVIFSGCSQHWVEKQNGRLGIYLKAEDAVKVEFVSSANQFQPKALFKNEDGEWVYYPQTEDSVFRYFYLTDGKLMVPECPLQENDDFGSVNCVFEPES